jgi:hypothetical protein
MNTREPVTQDKHADRDRYERPQLEKTEKLAEVTGVTIFTGNEKVT